MADLSDVTAYLAQAVEDTVYPNGTLQPSIVNGMDCRVYEGWPIAAQLDLNMAGKTLSGSTPVDRPGGRPLVNVSIYPLLGTGINVYQILDETYVITPPSYGTSFTLSGNTITVTGQPTATEYITLVCDDAFVYSATGANTASLLAALAAQASANYPGASSTAATLTVPVAFSMVVRHGASATLGKVLHRQRHSIMVTVWAPTPAARTTLAAAIDNSIKQNIKVTMPDSSQALVIYSRTNVRDEGENVIVYRRDLIYDVEYATVQQFLGYEITSTQVSIANPDNTAIATAVTGGDSEAPLSGLLDFSQSGNSQFIPLIQ